MLMEYSVGCRGQSKGLVIGMAAANSNALIGVAVVLVLALPGAWLTLVIKATRRNQRGAARALDALAVDQSSGIS
jgi:hypothetical protein